MHVCSSYAMSMNPNPNLSIRLVRQLVHSRVLTSQRLGALSMSRPTNNNSSALEFHPSKEQRLIFHNIAHHGPHQINKLRRKKFPQRRKQDLIDLSPQRLKSIQKPREITSLLARLNNPLPPIIYHQPRSLIYSTHSPSTHLPSPFRAVSQPSNKLHTITSPSHNPTIHKSKSHS